MRTYLPGVMAIMLLFCMEIQGMAAEPENVSLSEIAANISAYKDKTISLRLKLKQLSDAFGKIVFYDGKNHDIAFDYSERRGEASFAAMLRNCHEGMEYLVRFTVTGTGSLGDIAGELIEFRPVVLLKIPYGERDVQKEKGRKAE